MYDSEASAFPLQVAQHILSLWLGTARVSSQASLLVHRNCTVASACHMTAVTAVASLLLLTAATLWLAHCHPVDA